MRRLVVVVLASILAAPASAQRPDAPQGIGMVRPPIVPGNKLYFYLPTDLFAPPDAVAPIDSLVFVAGVPSVDAQGPPWLSPEVLKLDYELLWFRARTLMQFWIEVEVNPQGDRRWLDRAAVEFLAWPEFLLQVFAVETADPENNPVRVAPDATAPPLDLSTEVILRPAGIRGEWIWVEIMPDMGANPTANGWLRWTDGARLLVQYSLLS